PPPFRPSISEPLSPVHTPLKPHVCEVCVPSCRFLLPLIPFPQICKKSFKRPQDLKKHEKIHTEEHHAQHKHSKAITVNDPTYLSRVRGDHAPQRGLANKPLSTKPPTAAAHQPIGSLPTKIPFARTKPSADAPHYSTLPTPSPELDHHVHHSRHLSASAYDPFPQNPPSWDDIKTAQSNSAPVRNKRSLDYSVDDFLIELKKRKVNPSYDSHMAERLNSISYGQDADHYNSFNPRSISFHVRTPEELAAVNEFLVTLGRNVTDVNHRGQDHASSSDRFSPSSYFDPDGISQLGLAGMPGLPSSAGSFSQDPAYTQTSPSYAPSSSYPSPPAVGRSSHPSVQQNQYGSMYAADSFAHAHDRMPTQGYPLNGASDSYTTPSLYQSTVSPHTYTHPTPPLDPTSPYSSSSTPSNATPPHHPSVADSFQYDYIRAPRGAQPPVQLAAPDYSRKAMHTMVPLKTAPQNAPEPLEPRLDGSTQPAKLSPLTSTPKVHLSSSKLYPLLLPEDTDLRLPSLKQLHEAVPCRLPSISEMYRSPSPPSRSPDTSRGTTPTSSRSSPGLSHNVLLTLRSITETSEDSGDEHELAHKVGKIELDQPKPTREISVDDRRRHAELIRGLLLKINLDYKQRYGTPSVPPVVKQEPLESPRIRDVEMTVA
ncbi:hypothetical protein ID866_5390, partial [Astraeus odoratus]